MRRRPEVVGDQPEHTVQEGGDVDLTDPAVGEALGEEVEGDGEEGAPEEAVESWVVDAVGEETLGSDAPQMTEAVKKTDVPVRKESQRDISSSVSNSGKVPSYPGK